MTHVVHPYSHRLGIIRDWKARWFSPSKKEYVAQLKMDTLIREFLKKRLRGMYIAGIETERTQAAYRILIKTSRPGLVIGRSGEGATLLKKEIAKVIKKANIANVPEMKLDVEEVKNPESNAAIVAYMVAEQLEKKMPFRRVLKQTAEKVMANREVEGVRIMVKGRVGGSEMARKESIKKGRIPLTTLRADVDYAHDEAYLPYTGLTGVKVWIYRGEVFEMEEGQNRA